MSHIGFMIIGAQKAGSTSLFEYVRRHPQVHMPPEKELYFFNVDRSYQNGWDRYLAEMLKEAPSGTICGEATAEYMGTTHHDVFIDGRNDATVTDGPGEEVIPSRIRKFLPDLKLICVLRDPVERAHSHYQMAILNRAESRSFDQAISQLMEPEAIEQARLMYTETNGYIVNGEYARLLTGYLRVFARDQLLVIFLDELALEPHKTLAKVFQFIGVNADFVPDNLDTRYRTASVKQRVPGLNLFAWQTSLARIGPARNLWHRIPQNGRRGIDRVYNVLGYRLGLWNRRGGKNNNNDIPPLVREKLAAYFRPDGQALSTMLGREVPWLATSNHSYAAMVSMSDEQ